LYFASDFRPLEPILVTVLFNGGYFLLLILSALMRRAPSTRDAGMMIQRFLARAVAGHEVWILSGEKGAASCESNEHNGAAVILFFSDAAYARRACTQSIPDHQPARIDLFNFLYRWLPGMSGDAVWAGPNWTSDLVGLEIDPAELKAELEKRLSPEQKASFLERFRKEKEAEWK